MDSRNKPIGSIVIAPIVMKQARDDGREYYADADVNASIRNAETSGFAGNPTSWSRTTSSGVVEQDNKFEESSRERGAPPSHGTPTHLPLDPYAPHT